MRRRRKDLPDLFSLYIDLCREYFEYLPWSGLPVLRYAPPRMMRRNGQLYDGITCLDEYTQSIVRFRIRVGNWLTPERVRQVMLHELCHVFSWLTTDGESEEIWDLTADSDIDEHGPRFLACLREISDKGDEWAAGELKKLSGQMGLTGES